MKTEKWNLRKRTGAFFGQIWIEKGVKLFDARAEIEKRFPELEEGFTLDLSPFNSGEPENENFLITKTGKSK